MRYPPDQKARTRERILEAAGVQFRKHGYHATGIDRIMEEAGLTAGAFYAHFRSKEALLAEMLDRVLRGRVARAEQQEEHQRLERFVEGYLSPAHRDRPEEGCPVPALLSELGRSGELPKATFEELLREIERVLAAYVEERPGTAVRDPGDRALALLSLCVGGVALSRAVQDLALSDRILAACRELALGGPDDAERP